MKPSAQDDSSIAHSAVPHSALNQQMAPAVLAAAVLPPLELASLPTRSAYAANVSDMLTKLEHTLLPSATTAQTIVQILVRAQELTTDLKTIQTECAEGKQRTRAFQLGDYLTDRLERHLISFAIRNLSDVVLPDILKEDSVHEKDMQIALFIAKLSAALLAHGSTGPRNDRRDRYIERGIALAEILHSPELPRQSAHRHHLRSEYYVALWSSQSKLVSTTDRAATFKKVIERAQQEHSDFLERAKHSGNDLVATTPDTRAALARVFFLSVFTDPAVLYSTISETQPGFRLRLAANGAGPATVQAIQQISQALAIVSTSVLPFFQQARTTNELVVDTTDAQSLLLLESIAVAHRQPALLQESRLRISDLNDSERRILRLALDVGTGNFVGFANDLKKSQRVIATLHNLRRIFTEGRACVGNASQLFLGTATRAQQALWLGITLGHEQASVVHDEPIPRVGVLSSLQLRHSDCEIIEAFKHIQSWKYAQQWLQSIAKRERAELRSTLDRGPILRWHNRELRIIRRR